MNKFKILLLFLGISLVGYSQNPITVKQGDSFTALLVFDNAYDVNRLQDISVSINRQEVAKKSTGGIVATNNVRAFRVPLSSAIMRRYQGSNTLEVAVDDSILGVRRISPLTLIVSASQNGFNNNSVNTGVDATINMIISATSITTNTILATVMKGDKGDPGDDSGGGGTSIDTTLYVRKVSGYQLSQNNYTTAEKSKLSGIASGATANSTDAQLRDRSTHTGTQAQSTVTNLVSDLASKLNIADTTVLLRKTTAAGLYQAKGNYLTSINSTQVTTALGYTPYNATNPNGYITSSALSPYLTTSNAASTYQPILVSGTTIKTVNGASLLGSGNIVISGSGTAIDTTLFLQKTTAAGLYQPKGSYLTSINSSQVTTALGYTPYNSTNPSGYITSSALSPYLTSATAAITYQPIGSYLTSINSSQVTTALGYTPYNATNPSGFLASGTTLSGTGGSAFLGFPTQSASPPTPSSGFRIFANSSGLFSWEGTNGFVRTFDGAANTSDRTYTLPDASGTFGLLGSTQTWTGLNTFGGSSSLSSGTANFFSLTPTINQSGTAAYRGIFVSPLEQATGSGSKLLLDLGTNSAANGGGTHTSRFSVASDGGIISSYGRVFNTGNWFLGSSPVDAGFRLDVNGTARVQGQLTASNITDGFISISAAQINRASGNVEMQFQGASGVQFFGQTSFPSTFYADGRARIGGTSNIGSAQFNVESTTRGFLPPRMTQTQRNAIASPATGLEVYNTTGNTKDVYDGAAWRSLATSNQLNAKSDTSHTHTASKITDFNAAVAANSAVVANTAKVSNATHTGDVIGSTTLTYNNVVPANKGGAGSVNGILTANGSGTVSAATTTGSGNVVLATSPTLITPALGTPQSGDFSTGSFTWPTFNQNTTGVSSNVSGTVAVANGGTGATTVGQARTNLGLGTLATQSGTFSGSSSGTNTGDQTITLIGDVTGSGTGTFSATIANGSVTLAKMANVASGTILGRTTATTGVVEALSGAQVKTLIGLGSAENTAISTWAGSSNITTLGTIGTGVWEATAIADGKIATALTGKTYNGLTIPTTTGTLAITNGKTLTASNTITLSGTDGSTFNIGSGGSLANYALLASPALTGVPTAPTATPGTNTTQVATTAYVEDAKNKTLESIEVAFSDETTAITTGNGKHTFYMPYAMTVTEVFLAVKTPQSSGAVFTIDINEEGVSILSTKLTLDNNETKSSTAATPAVVSDTSLAKWATMTVDIDQSSGIAIGGKIIINGYRQ